MFSKSPNVFSSEESKVLPSIDFSLTFDDWSDDDYHTFPCHIPHVLNGDTLSSVDEEFSAFRGTTLSLKPHDQFVTVETGKSTTCDLGALEYGNFDSYFSLPVDSASFPEKSSDKCNVKSGLKGLIANCSSFLIPKLQAQDFTNILDDDLLDGCFSLEKCGIDVSKKAPLLSCPLSDLEYGMYITVRGRLPDLQFAVQKSLTDIGVEYTFDYRCIRWSGSINNECKFVVRLLQIWKDDELTHILEVQRLFGCAVGFASLYKKFVNLVLKDKLIEQVIN